MNPQLQKLVKPSSLLTWIVEHLFSKNMPATNRTPTLLKFEYLFGPTIKELLKGLTNCGYHSPAVDHIMSDLINFPFNLQSCQASQKHQLLK